MTHIPLIFHLESALIKTVGAYVCLKFIDKYRRIVADVFRSILKTRC